MEFSLKNQDGKFVSLSDFLGKYVIVYVYPKDNTPGCTTEAIEFSELKEEFDKLKTVVLGVSPDSTTSHKNFCKKHDLKIILLSDPDKKLIKELGAWGKKKLYGREYEGVIRSTFVFDREGNLIKQWTSVSPKGHAKEVLEFIASLS